MRMMPFFFSSKVSELEELNNHSVQENIALKDHLSKLQTQIQELEKNASINHSLDRDIKVYILTLFTFSDCMIHLQTVRDWVILFQLLGFILQKNFY